MKGNRESPREREREREREGEKTDTETELEWALYLGWKKLLYQQKKAPTRRSSIKTKLFWIGFVTLVESFVSTEESTHQMLNIKTQTLLNEICNFGGKFCISRRKHPSDAQQRPRLSWMRFVTFWWKILYQQKKAPTRSSIKTRLSWIRLVTLVKKIVWEERKHPPKLTNSLEWDL
jgi:hypothetical protein